MSFLAKNILITSTTFTLSAQTKIYNIVYTIIAIISLLHCSLV